MKDPRYSKSPSVDPHCFSIMGRIHVETNDAEALQHACSMLHDVPNVEAKALFYFAARCLAAHRSNRAEYYSIMKGV